MKRSLLFTHLIEKCIYRILPEPLLYFLRDMGQDIRRYAERKIIEAVGMDIDTLEIFGFKDGEEAREVIKRYGLNEVLQDTVAKEFC